MVVAVAPILEQALQLRHAGRANEALTRLAGWLDQRLALGSFQALDVPEMQAVEQLADLASLVGQYEAADALLAALVAMGEERADAYLADYAALGRIRLALSRGEPDLAWREMRDPARRFGRQWEHAADAEAVRTWQASCRWPHADARDRALLMALCCLTAAELCLSEGLYARALLFADSGQTAALAGGRTARIYRLPLTIVQARALVDGGDLKAATAHLERLRALADDSGQRSFRIGWLELAARRAYLAGELGEACTAYAEVVTRCQEAGFAAARLRASLNLAGVLASLNRTAEAEVLIGDVLKESLELADDRLAERASYLRQLVILRRTSHAEEVALVLHPDHAASTAETSELADMPASLDRSGCGDFLARFEDESTRFHFLLGDRDLGAARALLAAMRQAFGNSDSVIVRARLSVLAGNLSYYSGRASAVEADLADAARVFDEAGLLPDLREAKRVQWVCATAAGRVEAARRFRDELEASTDRLARSFDGAERAAYMLNKWSPGEEMLLVELKQLSTRRAALQHASWLRRGWLRLRLQLGIHRFLERVERQQAAVLRETFGLEAGGRHPALSFWRRLTELPLGRARISYIVLPDRLCVVVQQRLRLGFAVSPITRLAMRELTRSWLECALRAGEVDGAERGLALASLSARQREAPQRLGELGARISDVLRFDEVAQDLRPEVTALVIVPDDALHGFSFAMASFRSGLLSEHLSVSVEFDRMRAHARAAAIDSAFVAGVSNAWPGYDELPHAADEAAGVASTLAGKGLPNEAIECHAGSVSRERVVKALCGARLVHLACHGRFVADSLDQTGLLLVDERGQRELLSLRDLIALDASAARHVTLSSCWSAEGYMLPGRRIFSLPQALCRAGVGSVLACLWPVHDEFARAFMRRFYELADEMPKDRALGAVQAECREGRLRLDAKTPCDPSQPRLWGGFAIYGDPAPMAFARKKAGITATRKRTSAHHRQ